MITLQLLLVSLISMLLIPIIASALSKENDEEILIIEQNNTKDPRYFAESFKKLFLEAYEVYQVTGIFTMSRKENLTVLDTERPKALLFNEIVYSDENIYFKENAEFKKEIYSKKNISISSQSKVRAVVSEKAVEIANHVKVTRWIDGEKKLKTGNFCDLGINASSANTLIIGKNNIFRRLYAPVIYFSPRTMKEPNVNGSINVNKEIIRDLEIIRPDEESNSNILRKSIISKKNIIVTNGMVVEGAITTHGTLVIEANSIIHGNLFAEKSVYIGKNVKIYGTIFTQEDIDISESVQVGVFGKIKSVIARGSINIHDNTVIYGFVSCERIGRTR